MMKILSIGGVGAGSGLSIFPGDALLKCPSGEGVPGQVRGWGLYQVVLPGRSLGCRTWLGFDPLQLLSSPPCCRPLLPGKCHDRQRSLRTNSAL